MRNWLVLFLLLFLPWMKGVGQCQYGSYYFFSQEQIDDFPKTNPGCLEVRYTLTIVNSISNLDSLIQLQSIGELRIENTLVLKNLSGLSNIKNIENIRIYNNAELTDISQIEADQPIVNLIITKNNKLESITGFNLIPNLGTVKIDNNLNLKSISIGNNANKIKELNINDNPALESINGFDKLTQIEELIQLKNSEKLQFVNAFSLVNQAKSITIDNLAFIEITFLPSLNKVSNLSIINNKKLLNLNSFSNIENCQNIIISNNSSLIILPDLNLSNYNLYVISNNPELTNINFSNKTKAINSLNITNNTKLNQINFNGLPIVNYYLNIEDNPMLKKINNLIVPSILELSIINNPLLEDINFLRDTKLIKRSLKIEGNHSLKDINLNSLEETTEPFYLSILNNKKLISFNIPNSVVIDYSILKIESNPYLSTINIPQVVKANEIFIIDNENIVDLNFLLSLKTVMGTLDISSNKLLRNIDFLKLLDSASNININNNSSILNIFGLKNLTKVQNLSITHNSNLIELFNTNPKNKLISESLSIINNDRLKYLDLSSVFFGYNTISINENDSLSFLKIGENAFVDTLAITIKDNFQLVKIQANLIKAAKSLNIISNHSLTQIGEFSNLNLLFELNIELNPNLVDLTGMENMLTVTNISFIQNDILETLKDLKGLLYVNGELNISNNQSIVSLFSNLKRVLGKVSIINNPELIDITGLDNVDTLVNYMFINNAKLNYCPTKAVCNSFNYMGNKYFYSNGEKCSYTLQVKDECTKKSTLIYPNPAHNKLNFTSFPLDQNAIIKIYEIYGRQVSYYQTTQPELDISALAIGTYIIEVKSDKINYTKKFVKY